MELQLLASNKNIFNIVCTKETYSPESMRLNTHVLYKNGNMLTLSNETKHDHVLQKLV